MNHPTAAEVHDHVYGFRRSGHVEGCAACLRAADSIEFERRAIRDALADEPAEVPPQLMAALAARRLRRRPWPARVRLPVAGLAAAAAFLAGLAWLLFQERTRPSLWTPGAQSERDPLERLVRDLKGGTPLRREVAAAALQAYGEAASARLKAAGLDPASVLAARTPVAEDKDVAERLRTTRVSIDMQNAPLPTLLQYLQEISGIKITLDRASIPDPEGEVISFKAADLTLENALKLMLGPRQHAYQIQRGAVVIYRGEPPPCVLPAGAPVRIGAPPEGLQGLIRELGSDAVEARDAAAAALARLVFAAEPALWSALDSPVSEVRSRASDLLRRLYTRSDPPAMPADRIGRALGPVRLNLAIEQGTLAQALKILADAAGMTFLVDPRLPAPDRKISFKTQGLSASSALLLLLRQQNLQAVPLDDAVLITDRDPIVRSDPRAPVWLPPADARALEDLVAGLASEDAERRRAAEASAAATISRIGPPAFRALLQAAAVLDAPAARRCRAAARAAAAKNGLWLYDDPSGAELQRWTASQRELFGKKVDLDLDGETLAKALERLGVAAVFRAVPPGTLSGSLRGMRQIDFLKVATRLHGLDFTVGGETLVIDAAPEK
jgi:hypothetical protein